MTNLNLLNETRCQLLVAHFHTRALAVLARLGARAVLHAKHLTSIPSVQHVADVELAQRHAQRNLNAGSARLLLASATHSSESESLKDAKRIVCWLVRSACISIDDNTENGS